MDVSGIAGTSAAMSGAQLLTQINFAILGKGLEAAEAQGEAFQDMLEAAALTEGQIIDVYA